MKTIRKKLWNSKTDVIQSVVIGMLTIVVLLNNFSLVTQFLGKLNPLASYQKRLDATTEALKRAEERNMILEFDRVRLEDTSNILLALQDYSFQKNMFPESLESLKNEGYLDQNSRLHDPGTNQLYFYEKREHDFVFCIRLSDMQKGVNTTNCPGEGGKKLIVSEQEKPPEQSQANGAKSGELEIIADSIVNVRALPEATAALIARVMLGDTFTFEDMKNNWYRIISFAREGGMGIWRIRESDGKSVIAV